MKTIFTLVLLFSVLILNAKDLSTFKLLMDADGDHIYIKVSSIKLRSESNIRTAWIAIEPINLQTKRIKKQKVRSDIDYSDYDFTMASYYFNCDESKVGIFTWYEYNTQGAVIRKYEIPFSIDSDILEYAVPSSIGDIIMQFVCNFDMK